VIAVKLWTFFLLVKISWRQGTAWRSKEGKIIGSGLVEYVAEETT
jgi:hypothetical protein